MHFVGFIFGHGNSPSLIIVWGGSTFFAVAPRLSTLLKLLIFRVNRRNNGLSIFIDKNGYAATGCHVGRNQQVIHTGFRINDDFPYIGHSL